MYTPNTEKWFRWKIFFWKMSSLKIFYNGNHFTRKQTEHSKFLQIWIIVFKLNLSDFVVSVFIILLVILFIIKISSNSRRHTHVHLIMMWLLKSPLDLWLIIIEFWSNVDFKITSLLERHKRNIGVTFRITQKFK
jgi:hypothetical protein